MCFPSAKNRSCAFGPRKVRRNGAYNTTAASFSVRRGESGDDVPDESFTARHPWLPTAEAIRALIERDRLFDFSGRIVGANLAVRLGGATVARTLLRRKPATATLVDSLLATHCPVGLLARVNAYASLGDALSAA